MIESCMTSDLLSTSGAVWAAPGKVAGLTLIQASAAATLIIYDNASGASGKVLAQINTTVNSSTNTISFNFPIEARNGIYAAVTGTGAAFIVHFVPGK